MPVDSGPTATHAKRDGHGFDRMQRCFRGVYDYPMTVFKDGTGPLRHTQLISCSYKEIEGLLWPALETGRSSFVILSHSFELLNRAEDRPDDMVVKRFQRLCSFLDQNRDSFRVREFQGLKPQVTQQPPVPSLRRSGGQGQE